MRGSPSTSSVSFANAFMLSFVRALAAAFATVAACCFACCARSRASIVSTSSRAYQTSRLRASASFRIHSRYERTAFRTASRARPR